MYDATKEFTESGEIQLMEKLRKFELKRFFDVGANIGEWTKMVKIEHPNAEMHCFEPVPQTFNTLVSALCNIPANLNSFGLSNRMEILTMLFDHADDRVTTPCLEIAREKPEFMDLIMIDGDSYCKSRKIDHISFLKIDTEGHEYKVLRGFMNALEHKMIDIIQFEYGYANVLTKDLLIDFYKLLTPYEFVIGKLTPEGVNFKTYGLLDEDFKGPNYIAVHTKHADIIREIQAK